jgi:hypothetical protein
MAFACTENFDSYTNGDNLIGKNGGSGWTNAWQFLNGLGVVNVSNAFAQSGTLSVISTDSYYLRDYTSLTVGSIDFWLYFPSSLGDVPVVTLRTSGDAPVVTIKNDASNNMVYYTGTVFNTIVATPIGSWFKVTIEIDETNQAGKVNITVNGTNTGWVSGETGAGATTRIRFANTGFYTDSIAPTAAADAAVTPIPTLLLMGVGT